MNNLVIFLDIDGVLTCYKSIMDKHQLDVLYPNEFHSEIDEDKVKLLGNICGMKSTSCADQLAKAVRAAANEIA